MHPPVTKDAVPAEPTNHSSSLCVLPSALLLQLLTPVVEGILQADMRRFAEYALTKQKEASNAAA